MLYSYETCRCQVCLLHSAKRHQLFISHLQKMVTWMMEGLSVETHAVWNQSLLVGNMASINKSWEVDVTTPWQRVNHKRMYGHRILVCKCMHITSYNHWLLLCSSLLYVSLRFISEFAKILTFAVRISNVGVAVAVPSGKLSWLPLK